MGVERGSAGEPEFLFGNQFDEFPTFGLPVGRRIKNLRQSAPSDITNQRGFFLLGGRSVFGLKFANQFYRGEIGAALFLGRACANAIGGGNPVIVLIADYSLSLRAATGGIPPAPFPKPGRSPVAPSSLAAETSWSGRASRSPFSPRPPRASPEGLLWLPFPPPCSGGIRASVSPPFCRIVSV